MCFLNIIALKHVLVLHPKWKYEPKISIVWDLKRDKMLMSEFQRRRQAEFVTFGQMLTVSACSYICTKLELSVWHTDVRKVSTLVKRVNQLFPQNVTTWHVCGDNTLQVLSKRSLIFLNIVSSGTYSFVRVLNVHPNFHNGPAAISIDHLLTRLPTMKGMMCVLYSLPHLLH